MTSRIDRSFDELWNAPSEPGVPFDKSQIAHLPEPVQRYLGHSIKEGTISASAVRLQMSGRIKLKEWYPFKGEEVIRWERGFVWRATTWMHGLPIKGADEWIDGVGSMKWKMFGLIPVVSGSGPDVSKSALGRVQMESVWLPSVLLSPSVQWQVQDPNHLDVEISMHGESNHLNITIDEQGKLRSLVMQRWGNPKGTFEPNPFGGVVENEVNFGGFTIPTELRLGWHPNTPLFDSEGEFFQCTVEQAWFR